MFETETDGLYLVQTLKWWAIDPPALPPVTTSLEEHMLFRIC